MGYYSDLSIDTRTCGQADEDARLDRRDGYRPMTRTRVFESLAAQRQIADDAGRERSDWRRAAAENALERAGELVQAGQFQRSAHFAQIFVEETSR